MSKPRLLVTGFGPGGGTDLVARPALRGVTISNGFAFCPDGTRVYYVDTPTGRVDVFDHDPAAGADGLHRRRPVIEIPPSAGAPDGITVDQDGGIWVALWGGGAVRRYRPDGMLDAVVELPVSQVTACTFGGPDLGTLYVTTSMQGPAGADRPPAGALFAVRPGTRGLPVAEFAGRP